MKTGSTQLRVTDASRHADVNEYLTQIIGADFKTYREKWNKVSSLNEMADFPLFLVLEPLYRCNLQCMMCIHSSEEKKKYSYSGSMSLDIFFKIMEECQQNYCPSITIGGTCEPLLIDNIHDFVRCSKEHGFLDVMLNTNATLLSEELSRELIKAGLTRLRIGFDGAGKQSYEKIRKGAKYETVRRNIEKFIKIRNEMSAQLPVVRVSCVDFSETENELDEFVSQWEQVVDYVSIQRYQPHLLTKERIELKKGRDTLLADDVVCSQPFERLYIRGNGDVLACCQIAYGPLVGNVKNSSLSEIWNSKKMKVIRKALLERKWRKIPKCAVCMQNG